MSLDLQKASEVVFLALAVWREARGEPLEARQAVAEAIMNRVKRPSWWGKDVMSVVFKKWQFSSLTDPNDPQLTTWPYSAAAWRECLQIAEMAVDDELPPYAPGADSYYDISIPPPKWATPETFVVQLGRIRFHNLDGDVELIGTMEQG